MILIRDKTDEPMIEELNEALKKKDPEEPIEKTPVTFCSRTGKSMENCRIYYNN
jgi:hypothetical protein